MAFVSGAGALGRAPTGRRPAVAASRRSLGARNAAGKRQVRMVASEVDDKKEVEEYFNTTGFDRWNRIYSEDGEVNSVQMEIRVGHDQTVKTILEWIDEDDNIKGSKVCDAGCGVGSLSLPLLERGADVYASDISQSMVEEARRRAAALSVRFSCRVLWALAGF